MDQYWNHIIGLSLTIIGALILAVASLAWRTVVKIEKKQEEYIQSQAACQKTLPEVYVSWNALLGPEGVLTVIRQDRRDKWKDYDRHIHSDQGHGPPIKV